MLADPSKTDDVPQIRTFPRNANSEAQDKIATCGRTVLRTPFSGAPCRIVKHIYYFLVINLTPILTVL